MAGLACIFELCAEPLYILSQNLLLLKLRLVVETSATLLRCMTTYVLIAKNFNLVRGITFYFYITSYGPSIVVILFIIPEYACEVVNFVVFSFYLIILVITRSFTWLS